MREVKPVDLVLAVRELFDTIDQQTDPVRRAAFAYAVRTEVTHRSQATDDRCAYELVQLCDPDEAARVLGVSRPTAWRWAVHWAMTNGLPKPTPKPKRPPIDDAIIVNGPAPD